VIKIFPILLEPITHSSSSNLYSKSSLTSPVSLASAAIPLLISPGGSTPYLSLISHVVPPESVIAIIAESSFSCFVFVVFNPYKTLKVPAPQPITDIFNVLFSIELCLL